MHAQHRQPLTPCPPLTRLVRALSAMALALACLAACLALTGCGGGSGSGGSAAAGSSDNGTTSGGSFTPASTVLQSPFSAGNLVGTPSAGIDISAVNQGYVGAMATSDSRLKFQVTKDGTSFNYDMPGDGTPIVAPINMGDGAYTFSIMQNTSGSRYIELQSAQANVVLDDEFQPFLRPNIFCNYTPDDAVVAKARELVAGAANAGDALQAIYTWIRDNVTYDQAKAADLAGKSGYIPDPNQTLASKTGICFDYASLAAAMMRSIGIPCKIITGYVSPDGIYHAWNMVWIDGSWKTVAITVDPQTWTRIDLTFAAGGDESTVGNGERYEDRYVY